MSLLSDEEENLAQALEKDGKRTPASDLFRELTSPVFRYLYVKSSKKTDGEINSALIREAKKAQHAKDQEECQKRIEQVFEELDMARIITAGVPANASEVLVKNYPYLFGFTEKEWRALKAKEVSNG